jgi:hypothetical protein
MRCKELSQILPFQANEDDDDEEYDNDDEGIPPPLLIRSPLIVQFGTMRFASLSNAQKSECGRVIGCDFTVFDVYGTGDVCLPSSTSWFTCVP